MKVIMVLGPNWVSERDCVKSLTVLNDSKGHWDHQTIHLANSLSKKYGVSVQSMQNLYDNKRTHKRQG